MFCICDCLDVASPMSARTPCTTITRSRDLIGGTISVFNLPPRITFLFEKLS